MYSIPINKTAVVLNSFKYIEEACICDKVSRYDIRGKKVLAFEEKTYVCDLGFFHIKKNRVRQEMSHIIETICYNELVAIGYCSSFPIDFLLNKDKLFQ